VSNPIDSCGSLRGDSSVRPLYSTVLGLVFVEFRQSSPNYAFSPPLRVRKVLLLQIVIVYDRYIYLCLSYKNQSSRKVFRNLELTHCPLNLTKQLIYFTIEFSCVFVTIHNSYHLSLTLTLI
jgi:hypothetical protein